MNWKIRFIFIFGFIFIARNLSSNVNPRKWRLLKIKPAIQKRKIQSCKRVDVNYKMFIMYKYYKDSVDEEIPVFYGTEKSAMPQLRPKKIPNMQKLLFSKESEKGSSEDESKSKPKQTNWIYYLS